MPPLYGEGGDRAFARLQEEIMKLSTDHTIFAWGVGADRASFKIKGGKLDSLFAPSPLRPPFSGHA